MRSRKQVGPCLYSQVNEGGRVAQGDGGEGRDRERERVSEEPRRTSLDPDVESRQSFVVAHRRQYYCPVAQKFSSQPAGQLLSFVAPYLLPASFFSLRSAVVAAAVATSTSNTPSPQPDVPDILLRCLPRVFVSTRFSEF